jgi:hypothetical protein
MVSLQQKKRNIDPIMQEISDKFEVKLARGMLHHEALYEMAMEECESTPKITFTERSLAWIKMNNLHRSDFDRVCDKPSQQLHNDANQKGVDIDRPNLTPTPLWLIIVASVGSALILIFIVALIIIFIRKRSSSTAPNAYRVM